MTMRVLFVLALFVALLYIVDPGVEATRGAQIIMGIVGGIVLAIVLLIPKHDDNGGDTD